MRLEQGVTPVGLPEGQRPAGLEAGGGGRLTTNSESLTGETKGEARELGGSAAWLEGLKAGNQPGGLSELGPEMGGGGGVDPVENYFAKNLAVLDKMGEYIEAQRKAGKRNDEQVDLGGQPLCTFREYKQVYEAIKRAQTGGDRRPIEEIIREARRPAATPPPEAQPTPRPADWRDGLSSDQRQRLKEKEQRWNQLQSAQLVVMQEKIAVALSNWGLGIEWPDELKKAGVLPEDGKVILRALDEAVKNSNAEVLKQRIDMALQLLPEAADHIQRLQKELGLSSREAVIARLAADLQTAVSIGRNTDVRLFPPKLKHILIQLIKSGNGTVS